MTPRLIIIVGGPGSGKDLAIQGVNDLGAQHARIVPKHTSRARRPDDEDEMVCADDPWFALDRCDVVYENYGTSYGLESAEIWKGIRSGVFQVAVVSNIEALNQLRRHFGSLLVLVYVHSEVTAGAFEEAASNRDEYIERRVKDFDMALEVYLRNFLAFDHVLIWSGDRENLFDQVFRLFRAYEVGLLR